MCNISKKEEISRMTECSICYEEFSEPVFLPCMHVFCLKCIQECGEEKNVGEYMACPMCRGQFKIPDGGLGSLPKNFFIKNLIEINKLPDLSLNVSTCEICLFPFPEVTPDSISVMHCIDCKQTMCDDCSDGHKKHCKQHRVVSIGKEVKSRNVNACQTHPGEQLKYYCFECKEVICVTCFVEIHKHHPCTDYVNVVDDLRKEMQADVDKMVEHAAAEQQKVKEIEVEKQTFLDHASQMKWQIKKTVAEFKYFAVEQAEELERELESITDERLSAAKAVEKDLNSNIETMAAYVEYYKEVKDKASDCDAACLARGLHSRAVEMLKSKIDWDKNQLKGVTYVPMKATSLLGFRKNNIFGNFRRKGFNVRRTLRNIQLKRRSFQNRCTEQVMTYLKRWITPSVNKLNGMKRS